MKIKRVDRYSGGYARVEHEDGSIRDIPPLYAGQMLYKREDGSYRYDNNVPLSYWCKHDFLISKGWSPGYHYDIDWQKGAWDEHRGVSTNYAYREELIKTTKTTKK